MNNNSRGDPAELPQMAVASCPLCLPTDPLLSFPSPRGHRPDFPGVPSGSLTKPAVEWSLWISTELGAVPCHLTESAGAREGQQHAKGGARDQGTVEAKLSPFPWEVNRGQGQEPSSVWPQNPCREMPDGWIRAFQSPAWAWRGSWGICRKVSGTS